MPQAPRIEKLPYNWSTGRGDQKIVAIIAHGTVGRDSRAYLSRGGDLPDGSDKKVSIHVLIPKSGDPIYRYVPDSKGANHAGFGTMPAPWSKVNPNRCTLGFELENLQNGFDPYTEPQLLAMGWQINEWRRIHGPLPIYRHTDIDPPPRKFDTKNLTVAQIEDWCMSASHYFAPTPDWEALWGPIASPDQTTWNWAIPALWKTHHARLGKCLSPALYGDGFVVQLFEGGDVRGRNADTTPIYEVCFR
jgi:hypothetical protein